MISFSFSFFFDKEVAINLMKMANIFSEKEIEGKIKNKESNLIEWGREREWESECEKSDTHGAQSVDSRISIWDIQCNEPMIV